VTPETALLAGLFGLVFVAAVVTAVTRRTLTAVIAFGAYSLGLAMVWVLFRAPDVALTEAAVGAGVTTALFLQLVRRARADSERNEGMLAAGDRMLAAGDTDRDSRRRVRPPSVAVAALVTAGILLTVPALPAVGASETPAFGPVTEFYLTDSGERGIDNVVTAVLVVYRGFDTFGEIAVVFAAAVAVLAVLGREVVV
jgi:multicomponent Na+:H+ antiporter subunit B